MSSLPSDPAGPTGKLCNWVQGMKLEDVPKQIQQRAKYLILDGLGCAIVGAHLPWSKIAAEAVFAMEGGGDCTIIGWDKKLSPLPAALLNSTWIQGFELDDYHQTAPLHSNSILLPALLAATQHKTIAKEPPITGADFLLATIIGYETGPRIGNALYGRAMLTRGWHSGAVFGPSASAAAVSKLLKLPANQIEDALGIACTQAGGLMSAQYESMVKRMQHGFAARNGLFAALMARGGYKGIERVYEREYGGFLAQFGQGSGSTPEYLVEEVARQLGDVWLMEGSVVKPYAAMGATHCPIDCIRALQDQHPATLSAPSDIRSITIEMASAALNHGGWDPQRPLTTVGAQMSSKCAVACQLLDGQVLPPQFSRANLDRDAIWEIMAKTRCVRNQGFDEDRADYRTRVTVEFEDGRAAVGVTREAPRGVDPPLGNEEVLGKWRSMTEGLIGEERRRGIEEMVLGLETVEDVRGLAALLAGWTGNAVEET